MSGRAYSTPNIPTVFCSHLVSMGSLHPKPKASDSSAPDPAVTSPEAASETDGSKANQQEFTEQLVAHQSALYAYVVRLLPYRADAANLLQQVNLKLLAQQADFQPGTNFGAWASTIAYYEVLTYRRKQQRDRLCFGTELLEKFADECPADSGEAHDRLEAMEQCLDKLRPKDRQLVDWRYESDMSPSQIGQLVQRTAASISQSLYRIRAVLSECIRRTLAQETPS